MDLFHKKEVASNLQWAFNEGSHNQKTILVLKVEATEENHYLMGSVSLPPDSFIVAEGHPLNVTDSFRKRIKDLVKSVCGKPVMIYWNNTGTEFWFDPEKGD